MKTADNANASIGNKLMSSYASDWTDKTFKCILVSPVVSPTLAPWMGYDHNVISYFNGKPFGFCLQGSLIIDALHFITRALRKALHPISIRKSACTAQVKTACHSQMSICVNYRQGIYLLVWSDWQCLSVSLNLYEVIDSYLEAYCK